MGRDLLVIVYCVGLRVVLSLVWKGMGQEGSALCKRLSVY